MAAAQAAPAPTPKAELKVATSAAPSVISKKDEAVALSKKEKRAFELIEKRGEFVEAQRQLLLDHPEHTQIPIRKIVGIHGRRPDVENRETVGVVLARREPGRVDTGLFQRLAVAIEEPHGH